MKALVVTPTEAREMLKISVAEMYKLLDHGEIPAFKCGENWKIPLSLLQDYVESRAIKEAEERREGHGN